MSPEVKIQDCPSCGRKLEIIASGYGIGYFGLSLENYAEPSSKPRTPANAPGSTGEVRE